MCGARDFTNEESKPFSLFKINSVSQLRELKAGHFSVEILYCLEVQFLLLLQRPIRILCCKTVRNTNRLYG